MLFWVIFYIIDYFFFHSKQQWLTSPNESQFIQKCLHIKTQYITLHFTTPPHPPTTNQVWHFPNDNRIHTCTPVYHPQQLPNNGTLLLMHPLPDIPLSTYFSSSRFDRCSQWNNSCYCYFALWLIFHLHQNGLGPQGNLKHQEVGGNVPVHSS